MANKAIDKHYLLETLKDFYAQILLLFFQKKLTVTTVPSDPSNGDVIIYVGATSGNYTQGHIYKYSSGQWTDITATGATTWGSITGNLSNQEDLQDALDDKYDINDPVENNVDLDDYIPFTSNLRTKWETTQWNGSSNIYGSHIWTDGTNIYYSYNSTQYKLNGTTWETMAWSGYSEVVGDFIWSDGTNFYFSRWADQYKLNGTTWEPMSWSGLSSFIGDYVWSDGTNIYYSSSTTQYKLNGATWSTMEWTGLTDFSGNNVWSDGTNIYYSSSSALSSVQYKLNGTTWTSMTWSGYTDIGGSDIWTDGTNYYYSYSGSNKQYKLNGVTWSQVTWGGHTDISGNNVWTDGTNIYCSVGSTKQYALRGDKRNMLLSTLKNTICTDCYTPLATLSNGQVAFDNLNPNYGYELEYSIPANSPNVTFPKWTNLKQESGTTTGTIKQTYTISGGINGTSQFALRIKK